MERELTTEGAADRDKARDLAISVGLLTAFVGLVAFFAWLLTGFSCVGDDTTPQPAAGSTRADFCDSVDYGLLAVLGVLATLACGVTAVWRRSWLLAFLGLLLGAGIAVTPFVLMRGTSKCPPGTQAAERGCVR
jgi:hypothetical protein